MYYMYNMYNEAVINKEKQLHIITNNDNANVHTHSHVHTPASRCIQYTPYNIPQNTHTHTYNISTYLQLHAHNHILSCQ